MTRNNSRSKLFLALLALCFLSFFASPVAAEAALWNLEDDEFASLDDDVLPLDTAAASSAKEHPKARFSFLRGRHLQSSATTSESVNIWQKLKESIGLTIVGCILICCMPFVIYKNEGRHVTELARITYCKNEATLVDCSAPGDETMGKLVHFSGQVTVGDGFLDFSNGDESAQSALNIIEPLPNAILLKRTCYIYQKFEQSQQTTDKNMVGGGETRTTTYTVTEDWTPMGPEPPALPHLPNETNSRGIWDQLVTAAGRPSAAPSQQPNDLAAALGLVDMSQPPQAETVSPATRVGAFGLSKEVVLAYPQVFSDSLQPVPGDVIPAQVAGCDGLMKGSDNILRTFPEGQQPQNGDCKVVYEFAADGFDSSFVVQQVPKAADGEAKFGIDKARVIEKKCLGCENDLGDIWMVRKGRIGLHEMLDMAREDEKKILYLIRAVGCVLLLAGWIMLFSPFVTALQVLPLLSQLGYFAVVLTALIVSTLCCLTVTIVAYIRYRPVLAIGLLALAGAIWGIVAWRLNVAAETGGGN
ncbi:Protein of unknown function (DUF1625) [Seminavis robusta]|uniref:Transmembrane protein n=1 Tax=Seminavis robusta TaxID=568900 RepID=A0A9N8DU70_9STRA|nr:Protein of unknown function (DUF1625) [Seminavis robusta]|eukprot:Sro346_g122670.1 Protein of unknown function (DUF1625) (529) ;mRNA; f:29926-31618